ICRGDADDVRYIVRARICWKRIVIRAVVSGSGNEQYSASAMAIDGIAQGLGIASTTPTVVAGDDVDAAVLHHCDVVETLDCIGRAALTATAEKFASKDFCRPIDARNAHGVVADGSNGSSNVSTMAVVVSDKRIVVDEPHVHSVAVVDKPISIVVDAV